MPRKYEINGKTVQLYTIGEVAEELDRVSQTLRLWERRKIIPPAPYSFGEMAFSKKGRRLYSDLHRSVLKAAILKEGLKQGFPIEKNFTKIVTEAYLEISKGRYPKLLTEITDNN